MQAEEARAMARQMVEVYAEFATNAAAMPVIAGLLLGPAPWVCRCLRVDASAVGSLRLGRQRLT